MLGLSESGIDKIRRALGNPAEDDSGKALRFFLPDWLRAWARYSVGGTLDPDGELDSPESDSPWLEERRKWGAKREQVKYEIEIGKLVPLPVVHQKFLEVAGPIRRGAELLCQQCRTQFEESLDEADANMERVFPADECASDSDTGSNAC